jgi:hypothetical protein
MCPNWRPAGAIRRDRFTPAEHPPFSTLASAALADQAVELYWHALCRDVPFVNYDSDPLIASAAAELSGLAAFRGPKSGGAATPQTLFRGFTPDDVIGPYECGA